MIIGGDFNARTGEMRGGMKEERKKVERYKKVNKEERYLTGRLEEIE